jgi:hypothetical protein
VKCIGAAGGNSDQLKILEPTEGLRVSPGQKVNIVIQPASNINIKEIRIIVPGDVLQLKAPPWKTSFQVPLTATGTLSLLVVGKDQTRQIYDSQVNLAVIQKSLFLRLEADTKGLYFEHTEPDDFMYITVKGVYKDGIHRDLNSAQSGTVFTSNDPDIATVQSDGKVNPKSNGKTKIMVRNDEAMISVPVEVLTRIDSEISQSSTQNSVPKKGILSSLVNVRNKDAQRAIDLKVGISFPENLTLLEVKGDGWSCPNQIKGELECHRGNLNGGLRTAIHLKFKSEALCKNIEIVASLRTKNQDRNVDDNVSVLRLPCSG